MKRLKELKLATLDERRLRGDLIQFYKYYSGINLINWQIDPRYSKQNGIKRRSSNQLSTQRPQPTNCPKREYFFTYRVIPLWNALPQEVIQVKTTNRLDNFLKKRTSHSLRYIEIRGNNLLTINKYSLYNKIFINFFFYF